MEILAVYYVFVFVFVGAIGSFIISICGEVYEIENCLKDKKEFAKCVFMYQVAVKMLLEMHDINTVGIIILEVLTTANVWFLNAIVLAVLCSLLILKALCHLFWIIFRKRESEV